MTKEILEKLKNSIKNNHDHSDFEYNGIECPICETETIRAYNRPVSYDPFGNPDNINSSVHTNTDSYVAVIQCTDCGSDWTKKELYVYHKLKNQISFISHQDRPLI